MESLDKSFPNHTDDGSWSMPYLGSILISAFIFLSHTADVD